MARDKKFVVAILISSALFGVAVPWSPADARAPGPVTFTQMAVISFLLFGWCKAHASVNGIKTPYGAAFLMGASMPLGFPYYCVRAFGWLRGASLFLKGLGLLLAALLFAVLGTAASWLVRA